MIVEACKPIAFYQLDVTRHERTISVRLQPTLLYLFMRLSVMCAEVSNQHRGWSSAGSVAAGSGPNAERLSPVGATDIRRHRTRGCRWTMPSMISRPIDPERINHRRFHKDNNLLIDKKQPYSSTFALYLPICILLH